MNIPLHALDLLPIWVLFILTLLVFLMVVEAGFRLGNRNSTTVKEGQRSQVSAIMGTTLGLLTFLLAFTFGKAETRFSAKKLMVVESANAIGTAYLRTDLLVEPYATQAKVLLHEYIELHVQAPQHMRNGDYVKLEQALARSGTIEDLLWQQAVVVARQNPSVFTVELYIQALNSVFDIKVVRVWVALLNRIAPTIWGTLYFIALISMGALGYYSGLNGRRSPAVTIALVLTFSAVMLLIIDLDRPKVSLFKVNQQVMLDLLNKINTTKQQQ
ncbi:MAG: hypothetical protein GQ581_02805 [Methyloprofundus sp.]|nr:hypothetical protein [Methyloprofundus sp.]